MRRGATLGPPIGGAVSEPLVAPATDAALDRTRGWSALLFAILFFAGLLPLGDLLGSFGDSDATFVVFFAEDSNRLGTLAGGLVLALSGLSFLWFLSDLRLATTGAGRLHFVVTGAGTTFVVLLLVGSASLITVPYARTFGGAFDDESQLIGSDALLPQLGYVLVAVFAMWAFAAMVVAVTIAARRDSAFPRWLVRVGYVSAAFVFVFGSTVGGLLGVPVWTLCVWIHWRRAARKTSMRTGRTVNATWPSSG